MVRKIDTSHVVKLDTTNYQQWSLQVKLILKSAGVWPIVSGDQLRPIATGSNDDKVAEWDQADIEAQAIIVPLLDKKQTSHIFSCDTSSEVWEKLKKINSDSSTLNKQHTLSKFFNYKIGPEDSIVDAFGELEELSRALAEMGVPMAESAVVTKIVSALPDSKFKAFKKAWDSVPEHEQKMDRLLSRFRKEELEQKEVDGQSVDPSERASAFAAKYKDKNNPHKKKQQPKRKGECNYCKKPGHWERECRRKQADQDGSSSSSSSQIRQNENRRQERKPQRKDEGASDCQAFMGKTNLNGRIQDVWYSDSGASRHVTGRKDWLHGYGAFDHPISVSLTNNGTVEALGEGSVHIEAYILDKWIPCVIRNVIYIPGAVNLFSEGVMDEKGFKIVRENKKVIFYKNGQEGPQAEWINGTYIMKFKPSKDVALGTQVNSSKLWHDRLAHINMGYIKTSVVKQAVTGIKPDDLEQEFHCRDCHLGKETRQPFPVSRQKKTSQPGEIIHGDLSGAMNVSSWRGEKYFLLLKDDCTGFRHVTFLKEKSETAHQVKIFLKFIKNQTGQNVRIFKSDNGTEFVCAELQDYFKDEGILHETSSPYCPESNGKIEREMRSIKDTTRAMLQHKQIPQFLWNEAVGCSVYIHNRLLDRQSPEVTAFERIFKRKPDLTHLRVFGSTAYVQIPKSARKVWDPKAKVCMLVGYDSLGRKYRLYDPVKKIVFSDRNVTFWENEEMVQPLWDSEESGDEEPVSTKEASETPEKGKTSPSPVSVRVAGSETSPIPLMLKDEEVATPQGRTRESTTDSRVCEPLSDGEDRSTLLIETPEGHYAWDIPKGKDKQVVKLPPKMLRDRQTLRGPDRYRANMAQIPEEPKTFQEAISSPEAEFWIKAMEEEMSSLEDNHTWELVDKPENKKLLSPKWVYKIKKTPEGEIDRFKARLVVRGFKQEYEVDYFETFSTVCRYESIRFILALVAAKNLQMKQFDVKTAFLNGEIEEIIYMHQPEGFEENMDKVCLLKKSIYGLKQSPRCWNKKCATFLASIGLYPTNGDPCVYVGQLSGKQIVLALYVDDGLVVAAEIPLIDQILTKLGEEFQITVKDDPSMFVGIEIFRGRQGISLTQTGYIQDMLRKFNMINCRASSVPLQPNVDLVPAEVTDTELPFRELIGSLLFLARVTRPDIMFAVSKLAQFSQSYDNSHWSTAKDVLRYISGTPTLGLEYKRRSGDVTLSGFTDSDYAGDKMTRRSTSGFCFLINDSIISWCSQKQEVVALSSTEAEYIALCAGAKEACWLRKFAEDLGVTQTAPTEIKVDNTSAIRLVENPEFHKRTKHIDIRYHFTRELVEEKKIAIEYVSTDDQLADILTKPLSKTKHNEMKIKMGLKNREFLIPGKGVANFLLTMMVVCGVFTTAAGLAIQNSHPVLWRGSRTPVVSGYEKVKLSIELISPCSLLTEEIIHTDMLYETKQLCDSMYQKYFLEEMGNICPTVHELRTRHERAIPIILMVAGAVSVVGLGVGGVTWAAINSYRIGGVQEDLEVEKRKTHYLANQVNYTEVALEKLRKDFNIIVRDLELREKNMNELISKGPKTYFEISHLTSQLTFGRYVIHKAIRLWHNGKIHPEFFDYLNLTLPCQDECPLHLATPKSCLFSENKNILYMEFDVPRVNTAVQLVEADPFDLMLQSSNQTCRIRYVGPHSVILDRESGCTISTNIQLIHNHDLVMSPSKRCLPENKNDDVNIHFTVDACHTRGKNDHIKFVQIKPYHGFVHLYCRGGKITMDNHTQACPDDVFVLPLSASFKINDQEFTGSNVQLNQQYRPDPLFTIRTNRHIQPRLNYSALVEDPMANNHFKSIDELYAPLYVKSWFWVDLFMFVLIVILAIILIKCYFDNRSIKVKVLPKSEAVKFLKNEEVIQIEGE